jgi:5,10-methylenetetrahydromethanopterin reductase
VSTEPASRQVWLHGFPVPGECAATAAQAEQLGFDGLLLADSQNLVGDVFVELGVLARATRRLGLDRVVVVAGSRDTDPELLAYGNELFGREVLPRLRGRQQA